MLLVVIMPVLVKEPQTFTWWRRHMDTFSARRRWFETPWHSLWRHCNVGHTTEHNKAGAVCTILGIYSICFYSTHWGRDKMAAISQATFPNSFSCLEIVVFWFKFHWNLVPIDNKWLFVLVMAWRRTGDKPLSEPMIVLFADAYMRHLSSMGKIGLCFCKKICEINVAPNIYRVRRKGSVCVFSLYNYDYKYVIYWIKYMKILLSFNTNIARRFILLDNKYTITKGL